MEVNGQMLCASYAGVYLRDVSMSFAADRQLTIYGYYNYDAIRKFSQEEPDVPVYTPGTYYNGADKLLEAMKNGDMDIIGMNITYESFVSLRDHGYCLNLESDDVPAEVREYGNRLYPVFRDQLCYKGNLVALPTNAYSYDGIAYFREAIEEAGFAMEDMPTNMLDLIRFLSEWDDDYAEDNPDFMPLRTYGDIRASMIDQVIQRYINYCKGHDEMISFSSPLFRELMEAVMQMHTNNTVQMPTLEDEDDEDAWDAYYQIRPLMELEYSLLGSFDESEGYVVRPISLKDGLEPETYANMNVVFINPYSSHISDALKFLSSVVKTVHGTTNEYIFCSDMEEPLLNPNYDMIIHGYQESLESYQKIAEQAEDEESRQQAEEILEEIREGLNNTEQFRYLITEDELKHYKEDILPIVKVAQRTFLYSTESDTTTELNSLISRLRDGQMTLDQFIHDADGKLRMMQLEDE